MSCQWGYSSRDGPGTWAEHFPAARGNRQSPIDIQPSAAQYDPELEKHPLKIIYQPEKNINLENPGYTIKMHCNANSTLTGGPLGSDIYRAEQFHFHWGSSDDHGSEHTVDGRTYAAELHIVHYNSSKYKSFNDAVDKNDGLAVLGVFLTVGKNPHPAFKPLCCQLKGVCHKGKKCSVTENYSLTSLLPSNTKQYWTYAGSLTTPPCLESVQWIVFKESLEVSEDQLKDLRSLKCGEHGGDNIVDNYRPPCPLGKRVVRASFR